MLHWFWKLFFDKENPYNKSEIISALGILWFINLFSLGYITVNIVPSIINGQKGAIWMAAYQVFSRLSMPAFSLGIPWSFLLLVGSIAFVYRLYVAHKIPHIVKVIMGLMVYFLFRSLLYLPMFMSNVESQFSSNPQILNLIAPSTLFLKYILICFSFLGLSFILIALFESSKGFGAMDAKTWFILLSLLLSITTYILLFVFLKRNESIIVEGMDDARLTSWAFVLALLGIGQLVLIVYRLWNSPYSPWLTLLLFIPLLFVAGALVLIHYSRVVLYTGMGQMLLSIALALPQLFFLFLVAVPTERHSMHNNT